RRQRPVGDLDAVELEVLVVGRAGHAVGAQQRPPLDLEAQHHEVAAAEAQAGVARGREAEERVAPVVDVQHPFLVQVGHGVASPAFLGDGSSSVKWVVLLCIIGKTDMRYTLRQLEVFLAVARDASVSRAARALAMSQSAASGSLAELERQFGVQLFDRIGKRLALSALGRSVRARAEAVLEQAGELERALGAGDEAGRLRVGA